MKNLFDIDSVVESHNGNRRAVKTDDSRSYDDAHVDNLLGGGLRALLVVEQSWKSEGDWGAS